MLPQGYLVGPSSDASTTTITRTGDDVPFLVVQTSTTNTLTTDASSSTARQCKEGRHQAEWPVRVILPPAVANYRAVPWRSAPSAS